MATTQIDGAKQIRSATITTTQLSGTAGITDGQLATAYIKADGTRAFTADINAGTHKITGVVDGVSDTDAATLGQIKQYVNGLDNKASVRVATTGAESYTIAAGSVTQITGTTLNGISPTVNDRILVKNAPSATGAGVTDTNATGSNQPANGIYKVTNATTNLTVTRDADADANAEVTAGFTVFVSEGTAHVDTKWTLISNDPITVGTTTLQFTQTDASAVKFSGGLTKTGDTVKRDDLTGAVTTTGNGNATTLAAAAVALSNLAALAANSVIGNLTGSSTTPVAVPATAAGTASTVATRDASANTKANNHVNAIATTATAGSTTTLTVASAQFQQFTGSSTQTVVLPDATTLVAGQSFILANRSSGALTVNMNGGSNLGSVPAGTQVWVTVITVGTAAGTWDIFSTTGGGALAGSNFVDAETLGGTINGSNTAFTLANTPTSGTEKIFLNGVRIRAGAGNDYTISGLNVTMLTAPVSGDVLIADYRK